MTDQRVHSFSTKLDDTEFVDSVKQKYIKQGKKFSWVVIQALRMYEAKQEAKANAAKRQN